MKLSEFASRVVLVNMNRHRMFSALVWSALRDLLEDHLPKTLSMAHRQAVLLRLHPDRQTYVDAESAAAFAQAWEEAIYLIAAKDLVGDLVSFCREGAFLLRPCA